MKPKEYKILSDMIDLGIEAGINKFLKYQDTEVVDIRQPQKCNELQRQIHDYVMLEICENFEFDEQQ